MASVVELKARWNEVLDLVLAENRIAWLAFFDARIVECDDFSITLSFMDAEKFSGVHDFSAARKSENIDALQRAIKRVFERDFAIIIK